MPRGGKRKGAGRKAGWNLGKTKAVKLPESLIPEIVEFAKMVDSTLVDGLCGQEKVDSIERLVDILFDELDERKILERIAQKLLTLHTNEEPQGAVGSAIALDGERGSRLESISNRHVDVVPLRALTTKPNAETGISLTPDQLVALGKMKQFVQTPRQTYFRLTGYAGTGKVRLV